MKSQTAFIVLSLSLLAQSAAARSTERARVETPETESVQYGPVRLDIADVGDQFEIRVLQNGRLLHSWALDLAPFDLSSAPRDPLIFTLCDANKDGLDDLLVNAVSTVGAGPQAGMEYSNYRLFLQVEGRFEMHDVDLRPFAETRDPARVEEYLDRFFRQEAPLPVIGTKPPRDPDEYLLKGEERIVLHFRVKDSGKSLTVGISEDHGYLVYRFGKPGDVELEYLAAQGSPERRFLYRNEENYGFRRFVLRSLSFSAGDYRYTVYDNYGEGPTTEPTGIGVTVTDTTTEKVTTLPGDAATQVGDLRDLRLLDWLEKEETSGRDYEDEE